MSSWEWRQDAAAGLDLLRRINNGDESAFKEIEPLLKRLDDRDARRRQAEEEKRARSERRKKIGRKNSGLFEIAPAAEGGVIFSASGIVLLRKGRDLLVWRSGGQYWSGRQSNYAPAELEILTRDPHRNRGYGVATIDLTNHHGRHVKAERLTPTLILKYRDKINKHFGDNAAELVAAGELKKTVVLP